MIPYLTENTVFGCSLAPSAIIRCREGKNRKVTYNGVNLLTTGAKAQVKVGICPILTAQAQGVLQPCRCSLGTWRGFKRNVTFKQSTSFLTENSFSMCTVCGGLIRVKASMNFKVGDGNGLDVSVVNWLHSDSRGELPAEDKAIFSRSPEEVAGKEHPAKMEAENSSKARMPLTANKESPVAIRQRCEEERDEPVLVPLLCNMDQGEKCRTCLYPKASTEVHNDSSVLRKNYENKPEREKDEYDIYYESVLGNKKESYWTNAAHHIISGNQVFKKYPEIVRLANFYNEMKNSGNTIYKGYDINGAANCIMLISKDREYRQKADDAVKKNISAYDAMSMTGIQWHLGGHSYTFAKDEIPIFHQRIKLFTKKEVKELRNYAELVENEMSKIQLSLCQRKVCRNTPRQNAAFVLRMNNLSTKIKKYLAAFREKPHHSYPYYVSLEAFRYTFGLPRTGKIAVVKGGSNDENVVLEKYRVKRFEETIINKDANLAFNPICHPSEINPQEFGLSDEVSRKACIFFCENIEHFIEIGSVDVNKLPFQVNSKHILKLPDCSGKSTEKILQSHDTEILVFLRNSTSSYAAPVRKIKERLSEAGL